MIELNNDELLALEQEECLADRQWHIERHVTIKNTNAQLQLLSPLKEAQVKFLNLLKWCRARGEAALILVLKSRRIGFSTLIEADAFLQVLEKDHDVLVLAHDDESAKTIYGIFERAYMFYDLSKPEKEEHTKHKLSFGLAKGSIEVLTAKSIAASRSRTPQYLHCSEAAHWEKGTETAKALFNTVRAGVNPAVTMILETTANSYDPFFYPLWRDAFDNSKLTFDVELQPHFVVTDKAKWNGWIPFFVSCLDDPDLRKPFEDEEDKRCFLATLEEREHQLLEGGAKPEFLNYRRMHIKRECRGDINTWNQEFPETPELAFVLSGRPRFNRIKLLGMPVEEGTIGRLEYSGRWSKKTIWQPDPGGFLTIYKEPVPTHDYVIGADTCEGIVAEGADATDSDSSACVVLDISTTPMQVVAVLHGRISEENLVEPLAMLGEYYGIAYQVIESNSTGKHVCIQLPKHPTNYPREWLFHRDDWNEERRRMAREVGWRTHAGNRNILIGSLADALEEMAVLILDERVVRECMSFVIKPNGKVTAERGSHDDLVVALALAVIGAKSYPRDLKRIGRGPRSLSCGQEPKRAAITGY